MKRCQRASANGGMFQKFWAVLLTMMCPKCSTCHLLQDLILPDAIVDWVPLTDHQDPP